MLDYGYNFMNTNIFIDNKSTICIVKNPVFHSKTKHIEIRHHFIRDSNKKKLIQMIKIHTDQNVANLLTKAFDIDHWNRRKVSAARQKVNDDGLKSSVRRDLHFDDEDGITCLTNTEIFENLQLMGYEKLSDKLTFLKPFFSPQWKKTKSKVIKIPQSSKPTNLDADEVVHEERGDSVERAATTTASLDAEQDSGNINWTQSTAIPNVPFPQGIRSGGIDGYVYKLSDMVLDLENVKDAQALEIKKLKKRDEHMFDLSDLADTEVITDQEETIELVEDKGSAEKGVSATEDKDSTVDPVTTAGETVTIVSVNLEDSTAVDVSLADDVTLAETLMEIRSSASRPQKLKGVLFKELSEPTTITTSIPQPHIPAKDKGKGIMQEPKKPVKVKGKDQIEYDADVAQRLQAELDKEARLE
ncbi:hypothetical protein Tco_1353670 [Tanacetum coccineum]